MQLFAYDLNEQRIFAKEAVKQCDYRCIECGKIIRLRGGLHRQPHFFHVQPNSACRLNGKGVIHLTIQNHFLSLLPQGEAILEHPFKAINRIADVAWINKKLIFEIQYSPITAVEIKARNIDYASLGYQVIWIMHDSRYNQDKLSAAEDFLHKNNQPHYFTNIDEIGQGIIYDQPALLSKGLRIAKLPASPINPSIPCSIQGLAKQTEEIPHVLRKRERGWKIFFQGDYLIEAKQKDPILLKDFIAKEDALICRANLNRITMEQFLSLPLGKGLFLVWKWWIARPCIAIMRLILERSCK